VPRHKETASGAFAVSFFADPLMEGAAGNLSAHAGNPVKFKTSADENSCRKLARD